MKLDNDLLKNMISETLSELFNEATEEDVKTAEAEAAKEEEEAAKAREEAGEQQAALAASKAEAAKAAAPAGSLEESFQITKGRLRKIISEELISAKKQGIL